MKKLKLLTIVFFAGLLFTSCSITTHMVTNNPLGTKVGVATASNFGGSTDFSLERAAQNGNIQKISTVDIRALYVFIYVKYTTTVTGE